MTKQELKQTQRKEITMINKEAIDKLEAQLSKLSKMVDSLSGKQYDQAEDIVNRIGNIIDKLEAQSQANHPTPS